MKYLKIKNTGQLDTRILSLMGGTTKRENSDKIGTFGTGLKYSMAYLVRNNIDFKIFTGTTEIKLGTETENISDTNFNIITVNGVRTSITDSMGHDWTPWMIVREIYSNALDEGGASYEITEEITGEDGNTSIYIELTAEFLQVYNNWNDYFIVGKESFYEDSFVKIYPQKGGLKIYKQGILVKSLKTESLFNYDIKNATLNELREYKGFLEGDLYRALVGINDEKVIQYFIENLKEDHHEATLDWDYDWGNKFSPQWKSVLKGCKVIHKKAMEDIKARGLEIDTASNIVVPENLYKGLSKTFEGIGALRVSKAVNEFFEIYDEKLHDKVRKAEKLLENTGYYMNPELTYKYGVFGDKKVLAKICLDTKVIYISEKHMDQDLFSIMTMLVEENEHFKTGFNDHTREFQQHFIDLYVNMLVEKESVAILN